MLVLALFSARLLLTFSLIIMVILVFFKWKFNYWNRKNLPFLQPHFPFGNLTNPFTLKQKPGILFSSLYREMKKKGWKYGGIYIFTAPAFLVVDLECARNILTKDFDYFTDRGVYYNEKNDPVSAHLFYVGGAQWKTIRSKLNPAFTSSKIKMLFPTVVNCGENLLRKVEKMYQQQDTPLDIYEIVSSFTIDNLGSCAFGVDCKILKNENLAFRRQLVKSVDMSKLRFLMLNVASLFPKLAKTLKIRHYPKEVGDFFINLVTDIIENRKKNEDTRQDLMQLLMDLKCSNEETLTIDEITAQCLIFFLAGFETSASTMTFALYELSKQQDIQNRVREEIKDVLAKHNQNINYAAMMDLKYMGQVIEETMRKYPAALYLTRRCSKNYCIPQSDVVIEKGTFALIPVHGYHYDEEYFPEPEKFDPERFNEENKRSKHSQAYLPFGEGPRICIGKRFGLLQVKMGLLVLLKNFKFTLNWRTEEPITIKLQSSVVKPGSKVLLNVCKV